MSIRFKLLKTVYKHMDTKKLFGLPEKELLAAEGCAGGGSGAAGALSRGKTYWLGSASSFNNKENGGEGMNSEAYKKLSLAEFDRAAEKFDDNDPSVYNLCRKDYPDILEEVKKEPFESLLDAGCGTGAMLMLFCRDLPGKQYTGIDLSEKMIAVAKRKALPGVRFVAGDCEALPFASENFDVVTCSMSFHHYPNPELFFRSLAKVLKKGGRLVLRDMASRSDAMMWLMNQIEIPLLNKLAHKGDVHVYSQKDIQRLCEKSGLLLENYEVRTGFRLHCVVRKPE